MTNQISSSEKKAGFGLNIGSASILMIFVILCLVAFASLTTVSATADSKLNARVLERTTAYYEACNQAELFLEEKDDALAALYATAASSEEYFASAGHSDTYVVAISELQTLNVTIEILYPTQDEDTFYRVTGWQVITEE